MSKIGTILVSSLFALSLLSGCGGSSSPAVLDGSLDGNWSGTWKALAVGQNGTAEIEVAKGVVDGEVVNRSTGAKGTLSGTVRAGGLVSVRVDYPSGGGTLEGVMSRGSSGLSGTLTQKGDDGSEFDVEFSLR